MSPWKPVVVLVVVCLLLVESVAVNISVDLAANRSLDDANNTYHKDILMRGAKPLKPDAYLCTGYPVEEDEAYIVEFEAEAFADTAHHILIYGCENGPAATDAFWRCPAICAQGAQQIMFAWAKNAPPTHLPDGVGLRIGKQTSIKTIVLQIHYARAFKADDKPDKSGIRLHLSKEKQQFVAGVFLLMSYYFAVPPNETKYHVDVSCKYDRQFSMFPFAYRTHSHSLGSVITGYQHNNTGYHQIGKGNPQWPQAFYPTNASIEVKQGDELVARCTYNSVGMNRTVQIGATGNDEMCNFYIMFYTNASVDAPSGQCGGVDSQALVDHLPKDSDVTLPPRPWLEEEAHGHHHHHPMQPQHETNLSGEGLLAGQLEYESDWPQVNVTIGQVGGVATDRQGNVYIFHRGERVWNKSLFSQDHTFMAKDKPITQDTVVILTSDGQLVRKFGTNQHFLPQGIEVDDSGNIWLTDIALHQVLRVPAGGTVPDLSLGERFVSGKDDAHFCQPSDVAVLKSGEFFVSDGLCNSRILKFSAEGHLLKQWGEKNAHGPQPGQFLTPRSLTVAPGPQLVCVADQGNGRIQCFDLEGNFRFLIKHPQFGSALYAVEYCLKHGGLLFAVNGAESGHVKGFTFSLSDQTLQETWNLPAPKSLTTPQDVAVDARGHAVYVGEQNPPALRKFVRHLANDTNTTTATATPYPATVNKTSSTSTTTSATTVPVSSAPIKNIPDSVTSPVPASSTAEGHASSTEGEGSHGPSVRKAEKEIIGVTPFILLGPMIAIPLFILMVYIIIRHQNKQGLCPCCRLCKGPSLSDRLKNSRKGFDPLLQHVSEDSDSEDEMFIKPNGTSLQKK
ncbi:hypothetical protein ACOMHN_042487 [Nucella lapillus]